MTKQELWLKVNNDIGDLLFELRERWDCEKEYEDIEDYLKVIQKSIPEAFKIYKRPFGIDCKCSDGILNISVKVINSNGLKLIAKDKRN